MRLRRGLAPAALLAALLATTADARAQCAMCGSAAGSSHGLARGLAFSIFFMLGMLGVTVLWFVLLVVRNRDAHRLDAVVDAKAPPADGAAPVTTHTSTSAGS